MLGYIIRGRDARTRIDIKLGETDRWEIALYVDGALQALSGHSARLRPAAGTTLTTLAVPLVAPLDPLVDTAALVWDLALWAQIGTGLYRLELVGGGHLWPDCGMIPVHVCHDLNSSPALPPVSTPGQWQVDHFAPIDGQISFLLTRIPDDNMSTFLHVNGVDYAPGEKFILSGKTLTVQALGFAIEASDTLYVRYM